VPVLSLIPQIRSRTPRRKVVREPDSRYGEALRGLFLGVRTVRHRRIAQDDAVKLRNAGEASPSMVARWRACWPDGQRVLVIDCDWRSPVSTASCGAAPSCLSEC